MKGLTRHSTGPAATGPGRGGLSEVDDEDAAYRACLKYSRAGRRAHDAAFQRRLLAYLQRRGFSQSVSRRAMGRLIEEIGDECERRSASEE